MVTKYVILLTLLIVHVTTTSTTRVKRQGRFGRSYNPGSQNNNDNSHSNGIHGNGNQQSGNDGQSDTGNEGSNLVRIYRRLLENAIEIANQTVLKHYASRNNITVSDVDNSNFFGFNVVHGRRRIRRRQLKDLTFIETNALLLEQTLLEMVELTDLSVDELVLSSDFQTAFQEVTSTRRRPEVPQRECRPDDKFRSIDGTCNNLLNKRWGSTFTSQGRYLPPVYEDGVRFPRSTSVDGSPLPSPRFISNSIMKNSSNPVLDHRLTIMHMAWGQFLDHDFVLTPVSQGNEGAPIVDCCTTSDPTRIECFPISIPADDGHFTTTCMNFIRSTAGRSNTSQFSSYTFASFLTSGPREQVNAITSYIDGSNVYGSSQDQMDELRTGQDGLLKVSEFNFPPPESDNVCILDNTGEFCLKAGDVRVNVIPNLQLLHTLFVREHNRIARLLLQHHEGWNDRRLFDDTRKIISALMQHISYNEYLPILLGTDVMTQEIGHGSLEDMYDETVNPSVKNSFAAAAFRFGHSQIPTKQVYLLSDYSTREEHLMEDTFFRPHLLEQQNGTRAPDLSRWISHDPSFEVDGILEKSVRDFLFRDSSGNSFDLGSLNIQRGRDHGLPAYNKWREFCGLPKALSFQATVDGLVDHTAATADLLSQTYSHVDDIDLFVGGLTEIHTAGGIVGPTFSCIMAKQFSDLKRGDRFWYERTNHNGGFTPDQLSEIKKVSLAKVLCNNFGMAEIQPDVFRTLSPTNQLRPCSSYDDIDLTKW